MERTLSRSLLGWLIVWVAGCNPGQVTITGVLLDSPDDKARPLGGASVDLRDADGVLFDQAVSDGTGAFRVRAPAGEVIFAVVDGDGMLPTSFTGVSGFEPRLTVPRGTLFGFGEALFDDWELAYRGCGAVASGGVILGEVRNIDLIDDDTGEHPLIITATAQAESLGGDLRDGCYLDGPDGSYDPDAEFTGPAGAFLIPGVDEGLHSLVVSYEVAGGYESRAFYEVWMPPGGVAPRFPAWVETPFLP